MKIARLALGPALLAFGLAAAPPAAAQAWDVPSFLSPRPVDELGVYVLAPRGADWGLAAMWRQGGALNLGVRGGFVSGPGDTEFFLGSELWGDIARAGFAFPLDVVWAAGLGAGFGDGTFFRFPLGVSAGRSFDAGGFALYPYVHPRIALELFEVAGASDTDLAFTTDLGAHVTFGTGFMVRFAVALGDRRGWGFGLAVPRGRTVVVR